MTDLERYKYVLFANKLLHTTGRLWNFATDVRLEIFRYNST